MKFKSLIFICFLSVILLCFQLYWIMPIKTGKSNTVDSILSIFDSYILTYDIDKKSIGLADEKHQLISNYEALVDKIRYFVNQNKKIILTMVGFPYKSSNTHDKVLDANIDAAERFCLEYIHTLLSSVQSIYPPGVELTIFTDGLVFSDLEKVSDSAVIAYEDALKLLTYDLPAIKVITLRDMCETSSIEIIRNILNNQDPTFTEFQEMMQSDKKMQEDYILLKDRLKFELVLSDFTDSEISSITLQEMHRGMQYSNFLKKFRPIESITGSVHYQKDLSRKIGLKLSDSCITPWHGMLVKNDNHYTVQYVKDIDLSAYKKAYRNVNGLSLVYLESISN